jgi:hypothetical protein
MQEPRTLQHIYVVIVSQQSKQNRWAFLYGVGYTFIDLIILKLTFSMITHSCALLNAETRAGATDLTLSSDGFATNGAAYANKLVWL